jgi:hypothetical protein
MFLPVQTGKKVKSFHVHTPYLEVCLQTLYPGLELLEWGFVDAQVWTPQTINVSCTITPGSLP